MNKITMKKPQRGEGALETIFGLAFWGLIIWGAVSLFGGGSSQTSTYYPSSYGGYNDSYYDDYEEEPEIGNPYSDGSGHYAGYEWAEENDTDYCDGNSDSFNEGCQEYIDQRDAEEEYEDSQNDYDY